MSDPTMILRPVERGNKQASEDLLLAVYEELRRLAVARMANEAAGHTLQPTALVHEAWLRLAKEGDKTWPNRTVFFAAAAEAMRRILVDHARHKARLKRGGGQVRLNLADLELTQATPDEKILLLNEALVQLEADDPERARVVVLKYFGGLSNKAVADQLGIGERTVNRHWVCARDWLFRKIKELR